MWAEHHRTRTRTERMHAEREELQLARAMLQGLPPGSDRWRRKAAEITRITNTIEAKMHDFDTQERPAVEDAVTRRIAAGQDLARVAWRTYVTDQLKQRYAVFMKNKATKFMQTANEMLEREVTERSVLRVVAVVLMHAGHPQVILF